MAGWRAQADECDSCNCRTKSKLDCKADSPAAQYWHTHYPEINAVGLPIQFFFLSGWAASHTGTGEPRGIRDPKASSRAYPLAPATPPPPPAGRRSQGRHCHFGRK